MIDEENRGEKESSNMDGPEEDGNLGPGYVHARHEDEEREHKLQESHGGDQTKLSPDIEGVEVCAVENACPHPRQEEYEVPVVEVANTVPSKHAVVLPLKNAHPAHRAVPSSGGRHRLAHSTIVPSFLAGI